MSRFSNLCYVTDDGLEAPVDPSSPDNPFMGITELALRAVNAHKKCLRWTFGGVERQIRFSSDIRAAIDPKSDLLVVALSYADPTYTRPCNAAAFNPDGSLEHQICPPSTITHGFAGGQAVAFPVECIDSVSVHEGRVRVDLNFMYEWIQERYYDTASRTWSGPLGVYRK